MSNAMRKALVTLAFLIIAFGLWASFVKAKDGDFDFNTCLKGELT